MNQKDVSTNSVKIFDVCASVADYFKKLKASVEFFTLENGLEVFILPDKRSNRVLVDMSYRVGSSAEGSSEKGMAHLVEHMIFKGTEKMSESDLNRLILKYGASANADTCYDVTNYYFLTDSQNYKPFLEILADSAQNSRFDSEHLASELKAVVQELNMYQDSSYWLAMQNICIDLFQPNHPYHFYIGGYTNTLSDMTAEALKAFFKRNYHPKNATLFIAGDVDLEKIKKEIREIFSPWDCCKKARNKPNHPKVIGDVQTFEKTYWRNTSSAIGHVYFYAPTLSNTKEHLSFELLSKVLVSENGRLNKLLIDEKKIATSISIVGEKRIGEDFLYSSGVLIIKFECDPANLDNCYKVILDQLRDVLLSGVSVDELDRVRTKFILDFVCQWDELLAGLWSDFARKCVSYHFATDDPTRFFDLPQICNSIIPSDLDAVARKYLRVDLPKKLSILPFDQKRKDLWLDFDSRKKAEQSIILEKHKRKKPLEPVKLLNKTAPAKLPLYKSNKIQEILELDSGLTVIAQNCTDLPLINCYLVSKKQAANLENMGSLPARIAARSIIECQDKSKVEIMQHFESLGAKVNFDLDQSFLSTLAENFDQALRLFLSIITAAKISGQSLEKQISIMDAEFKNLEKNPRELAFRELYKNVFPNSIFSWDFKDAQAMLSSLSVSEIELAYKKEFCPENYVFSIAGKLPADWKTIVKNTFSSWRSSIDSAKNCQSHIPTPNVIKNKVINLPLPCDQVFYLLGRGSDVKIWTPLHARLSILKRLLFEGHGSRLFEIRERTGLFYRASGAFAGNSNLFYSLDWIFSTLNPQNVRKIRQEIEQMFIETKQSGFDEFFLQGAKIQYINKISDDFASTKGKALSAAKLEIDGFCTEALASLQNLVGETCQADLIKLCNEYCNIENMIEIIVGSSTSAES